LQKYHHNNIYDSPTNSSVGSKKLHKLAMFQITEAFDKYRSSMEKVGKAHSYSYNTLLDKVCWKGGIGSLA
jgi:hypothetical protein